MIIATTIYFFYKKIIKSNGEYVFADPIACECIVIIDMANTIPKIVAIACNADGRNFSTFVLNSPPKYAVYFHGICNHNPKPIRCAATVKVTTRLIICFSSSSHFMSGNDDYKFNICHSWNFNSNLLFQMCKYF